MTTGGVRTALAVLAACSWGAWCAAVQHAGARSDRPNIVVMLADDVGVDLLASYGVGSAPACTPNIDALASRGLLFRNAWSCPGCSPTRAQILTGLYGFRSGVGQIIKYNEGNPGLSLATETLPSALVGYANSAVGKWHLADRNQGDTHPLAAGYSYFAGSMYNLNVDLFGGGYYRWRKNVNGTALIETQYATSDTADEAIDRARLMAPPWFLYVAFNAPHLPTHEPPASLCPGSCTSSFCPPGLGDAERIKAALEALDTEVGRVLDGIDPNAIVIFLGDNGSTSAVTEPPFDPAHAKGTVYQGGVHIPLIVAGPGVRVGETDALVSTVDLPATIAELAGAKMITPDSVSFAPILFDANAPAPRTTVYTEVFGPNFDPTQASFQPEWHWRAVRNMQYKVIRQSDGAVTRIEMYDLTVDPHEQHNLFPPKSEKEQENYALLDDALVELGVACAADADRDGDVDLVDLAVLLSHFGEVGAKPEHGDANRDGAVELADLAILLAEFATPC